MIDLDSLNENQRAAVECIDVPSLVVAGAGSGKTRVLTYKIAYLLDRHIDPASILVLTFTKKAANEMKERIASMVGHQLARRLWMGTFHSVFMRILQTEHELVGFPRNFTIYDNTDSRNLVKALVKEMGLDDKQYKPGDVFARISNAKNALISPSEYAAKMMEHDRSTGKPSLAKIYKAYWDRCRQCGVMDFDDLLVYTYLLFHNNPEVCRRYAEMFRYILVDEYQDTNFAQHKIMTQLSQQGNVICVVGDDAQSIYSFRGAKIDNILSFTKLYPNAKIFKLEQNYRSTQSIVSAANSLIKKNLRQIPKDTYSCGETGQKLQLIRAYTDLEEAVIVVGKIKNLLAAGEPANEITILYRTNSQSRVFEEELVKNNVPHKVYGGMSFYQRKEIKDVMAYFRLVCNPNDEEAFKRVINYPKRGIGDTTVGRISAEALRRGVSLWDVASDLSAYDTGLSPSSAAKVKLFVSLIGRLQGEAAGADVSAADMTDRILQQTGIKRELAASTDIEDISKRENVEELYNAIASYCQEQQEESGRVVTLNDYLAEVSLLSDITETQDDAVTPRVNLMTIHAAKGLEFADVFIVGLEDGLFPYVMDYETPPAIEEERRLCYVAITRAKRRCYLSYTLSRFRFGKMEACRPSRFIADIDSRYIQSSASAAPAVGRRPVVAASPATLQRIRQSETPSAATRDYSPEYGVRVGDRIRHERFGLGTITRIEDTGDSTRAHVEFDNVGSKQLLLKYAKFTRAD